MINRRGLPSCAVVFLLSSAGVAAQTTTVPSRLDTGCAFNYTGLQGETDAAMTLTVAYSSGNWLTFHSQALGVIRAIVASQDCKKTGTVNLKRDVVVLLWVGSNALQTQQVVYRAIVREEPGEPFGAVLPGVGPDGAHGFEIFVSPNSQDAIASAYVSTRKRNPLEEQVPAFARAVLDPLLPLLAKTKGELRLRPGRVQKASQLFATTARLLLPYERATVNVDVRVSLALSAGGLEQRAKQLNAAVGFTDAAHVKCASTLGDSLSKVVVDHSDACAHDPAGCPATVAAEFNSSYDAALKSCTTESEEKALQSVDTKFRALATDLSEETISGAFELTNAPKDLLSFGVMTAFALETEVLNQETRAKMDGDTLAADPLGPQLTLVVVNIGFKRYPSGSFKQTRAERYQWFAGAVISPDFGLATGVSAGIVRGLRVNLGVALLGVLTLRTNEVIGGQPSDPAKPLKLGTARATFLGASYNF